MAQVTTGNPLGLESGHVFLVDADGTSRGTSVATLAAGATSHSLRLKGPKAFGLPAPTRNITTAQGGDKMLGQHMWAVSDLAQFTLDMSEFDANLVALISGSSIDQASNTEWTDVSPNYNQQQLPQVGMILSAVYQSRDAGTDGATKYINYLIPRCQMGAVAPPLAFQAENVTNYQVTPTFSDKLPTGESFPSALNLADGRCIVLMRITDYPLAITSFTHDGVETTFNTAFQPINTDITVNATKNYYVEDGITEALSSIVVATGLATVDAFATTGTKSVLMYETQHQAVTV